MASNKPVRTCDRGRPRLWWSLGLTALAVVGTAMAIERGSLWRGVLPGPWPPRRERGYRADLAYLGQAVKWHEHGASRAQIEACRQGLQGLDGDSVDALVLQISRATAHLDNAGTGLVRTMTHRLPLRLAWFADSLVVVRARPEHAELVGGRVLRIAGGDPEDIWRQFAPWVGGGTTSWLRYRSAWFLSIPDALAAVGQAVHDGQVAIEVERPDGTVCQTRLSADVSAMPASPVADWRDLFDQDQSTSTLAASTQGWVRAGAHAGATPLYLSDPDQPVLCRPVTTVDGSQGLYLRLLGTPEGDGPTPSAIHAAVQVVRRGQDGEPGRPWARFVVDLRFHSGGDYRTTLPLVRAISETARAQGVPIKLLVGPNLTGGGLIAASQYLVHAQERTMVLGTPVGDTLRTRNQGRIFVLPYSRMAVRLCHDWNDVADEPNLLKDVWLPDKFLLAGVGRFEVDRTVQNTWQDYLAGADRVLEQALAG